MSIDLFVFDLDGTLIDSRLDLAGIGLGFGLNVNRFGFDYAYNDWSSLGGIHHLTVQTRI